MNEMAATKIADLYNKTYNSSLDTCDLDKWSLAHFNFRGFNMIYMETLHPFKLMA